MYFSCGHEVLNKNEDVVKISGKRYDPHNLEMESFPPFTGFTKAFI